MDSENVAAFVGGFFTAVIVSLILVFIFFAPVSTDISRDIINSVQQSTNIVEALKKEHLIIRDISHGTDSDTVELVIEYDFLYKNSKMR
jgi:hypothetical protein